MINGIFLALALSNVQSYAQIDYCSAKFQETGFLENHQKMEKLKETVQLSTHEITESKEVAIKVSKDWNYNLQGLHRCFEFESNVVSKS